MLHPLAMGRIQSRLGKLLGTFLAVVLAIQPSLSYGRGRVVIPRHNPTFDGQAFEGVNFFARPSEAEFEEWSKYLESEVQKADPTNIQKIAATGDDLVDLMITYRDFYAENMRAIDRRIEEVGYEKFFEDELEKNEVFFEKDEVGKMQFSNVDGHPVAKIVHKKSGVAFIVYDENLVSKNSKHFKKYIARQHYDAGATRKRRKEIEVVDSATGEVVDRYFRNETRYIDENGKKRRIQLGRDVLIMGIKNGQLAENGIEVSPRRRGLKHWWRATYKKPSVEDTVFGFISGFAQFASVAILANMVAMVLPGYEAQGQPAQLAKFTLAFGSLFGIFNSFYQNWRIRGPQWVQSLKNMSISWAYYFGVYVITQGGVQQLTITDMSIDPFQVVQFAQNAVMAASQVTPQSIAEAGRNALSGVSDLGLLGVAAAVHPLHNFIANNEFKNWTVWNQRIEEIERRDLHNVLSFKVPVPVFSLNEEIGRRQLRVDMVPLAMTRRYFNRQFLYYLPGNWAKFLDQVWFTSTIGPAMAGEYPWWTPILSMVGFWGVVGGSIRRLNFVAYKNHREAAEKLHIREGSTLYYPKNLLQSLYGSAVSSFKNLGERLGFRKRSGVNCDSAFEVYEHREAG